MPRYELILGLGPDLSAASQKKILEKAKSLISDLGGKVGEVKSKGLTGIAYPIGGSSEMLFASILFTFDQNKEAGGDSGERSLGEKIDSLRKELGLSKGILRSLVIRREVKRKK